MLVYNLIDLLKYEHFLLLHSLRYVFVVDALVNLALHHGRPAVILDVTPPPGLRHLEMLGESLFTKEFSCVIIRVCYEIL